MPYGALIKLVPAHWKKGNDLDKNSRSCWYRPGFRWSPERGQSVVPKKLKKFKVKVITLKIKAKFFRLSHDVVTHDVDRDVSTAYC